jgi:thymidylate synthase (FAD)
VNIVKPYARIMDLPDSGGIDLLRKVEAIGRVSHRSEDAQTATSYDRFIRAVVIGHGDWSIAEHASVTVEAVVDRGITHEWVRHRLFAYTQESTRFVNYEKKMPPAFVEPPGLTDEALRAGNGEAVELSTREEWRHAIHTAESAYRRLIARGAPPQIARSVFPNALASKLVVTGNLRAWRHFFVMRTTKEAHPQMREVTIPLLAEFKARIPILYEDIEPEARQADGMRLPR